MADLGAKAPFEPLHANDRFPPTADIREGWLLHPRLEFLTRRIAVGWSPDAWQETEAHLGGVLAVARQPVHEQGLFAEGPTVVRSIWTDQVTNWYNNYTIEYVPDGGHFLMMEKPEIVIDRIRRMKA